MMQKTFILNKNILKEQKLFESTSFVFPDDYEKRHERATSVKPSPNSPRTWVGVNDDWYESKEYIIKKYRGVPVKMKHVLNIDGSDRGYKIIQVGFDDDIILVDNGRIPGNDEVRSAIDNYYNKFNDILSKVQVRDNELEELIKQKNISTRRIYEDDLVETADRWLFNRQFTILEKRKILKLLINKGLDLQDAISYFKEIR